MCYIHTTDKKGVHMADVVVTITVPIERLPRLSEAITEALGSTDGMQVERVENTRRPARNIDWEQGVRDWFKAHPGESFSTGDVVEKIHQGNVQIHRVSVSRYLSHLVAQGYLKPEGEGRFRRYQINPLTMHKEG